MQYQTFPGLQGDSRSLEKLISLRLPSLSGKRYLDVGCNEGYFCGYALYDRAASVVGIDKSGTAIQKARSRFPEAQFHQQTWEFIPEGPFDVITLLSSLHYAEDQSELIHRLMGLLAKDGLLVLEIGISPGVGDKWVKVKRSIDERYFPTRQKVGTILQDYAWKIIGHGVEQAGDPLQRYVIHVRRLRPYAYLMMESPGSGKTTISRNLFQRADIIVIKGDMVYFQISSGKHNVSQALQTTVSENFTTADIDKLTARVFGNGLAEEIIDLWLQLADKHDFALDSYVPEIYQNEVREALFKKGYFPVDMNWSVSSALYVPRLNSSKAHEYEADLMGRRDGVSRPVLEIKTLLPESLKKYVSWNLDSPRSGQLLVDGEFLTVAGWIVTFGQYQKPLQLYIKDAERKQLVELSNHRNDVLKTVFGGLEDTPIFWQEHACGFRFKLPADNAVTGFEIGLFVDDQSMPLAEVVQKDMKHISFGKKVKGLFKRMEKMRI